MGSQAARCPTSSLTAGLVCVWFFFLFDGPSPNKLLSREAWEQQEDEEEEQQQQQQQQQEEEEEEEQTTPAPSVLQAFRLVLESGWVTPCGFVMGNSDLEFDS